MIPPQFDPCPENCWARDEHEGRASELVARMEDADEPPGGSVQRSFVAPNEHTFYLMVEADTFEGLTSLLRPPLLQDHEADVAPVTTFDEALDTLDVEGPDATSISGRSCNRVLGGNHEIPRADYVLYSDQ